MNIIICSREEVEKKLSGGEIKDARIVSFCDTDLEPVCFSAFHVESIVVRVDDISYDELEGEGIAYEDFLPEAKQVAKFIINAVNDERMIVCQCEYGESRSAGCAAAILEFYEHKGIDIFVDYKRCPSQLIYHKIYDALCALK